MRSSFMGLQRQPIRKSLSPLCLTVTLLIAVSGCGGSRNYTPPPIVLTVSLGDSTVTVVQGGSVLEPVTIDAPTETASFTITGLPAGVAQSYKESESNPSGLLTITANSQAVIGTYKPTITVGSSGQTTSLIFTLVVSSPTKAGELKAPTTEALRPSQ
jgi:hypothetical protein